MPETIFAANEIRPTEHENSHYHIYKHRLIIDL